MYDRLRPSTFGLDTEPQSIEGGFVYGRAARPPDPSQTFYVFIIAALWQACRQGGSRRAVAVMGRSIQASKSTHLDRSIDATIPASTPAPADAA